MRLIIEPDYARMSDVAANHVIDSINASEAAGDRPFVLGLPTGSSPVGMYERLV